MTGPASESDDPAHPIPFLGNVDFVAVYEGGRGALFMTLTSPLDADERTQRRLLDKLHTYLRYTREPEYLERCGNAPAEIRVDISDASHPVIFQLLDRCAPWVAENGARLVVERRPTAQ